MSQLENLKRRAQALKREIAALFLAARHPRTPWYAKLLLLAIVAYAVSPIDLIPDFIPVVGLLDDVLLLPLAIALVLRMIPPTVMAECRSRGEIDAADRGRVGRFGAIGVALLWVALLALAALWAYPVFAHAHVGAQWPLTPVGTMIGRRHEPG